MQIADLWVSANPKNWEDALERYWYELPSQPDINYCCFVDPASGVPEGDSFAAVVGHKFGDRVVIDAIREVRPPFNFFEVVETILLPLCKSYRIYKITGDNYAGELVKQPIRRAGISYELSEKHKSELYLDPFLGMLNAGRIDLPKHERAINQICSLERSVKRTGREEITHPIHGHDDIANCVAGAVDLALSHSSYDRLYRGFCDDPPPPEPDPASLPPLTVDANWWVGVKARAAPAPTSSADDRLREMYGALDTAIKWGRIK